MILIVASADLAGTLAIGAGITLSRYQRLSSPIYWKKLKVDKNQTISAKDTLTIKIFSLHSDGNGKSTKQDVIELDIKFNKVQRGLVDFTGALKLQKLDNKIEHTVRKNDDRLDGDGYLEFGAFPKGLILNFNDELRLYINGRPAFSITPRKFEGEVLTYDFAHI